MIRVCDIEKFLFDWAPKELAADWDNVGHLVGEREQEIHKVLVSLDITEAVVAEAVAQGADLIVAHHPVMNCKWHQVQSVRDDNAQGRMLLIMARNGISAICMHTNLDAAEGGVNTLLAEKLGLHGLEMLNEEKIGRVGVLNHEIPLEEYVPFVVQSLDGNGARYTDCGKKVYRVAVGGGACADYIANAIALGCDTFVTSDLSYHEFLDTKEINLIDAGHFPTENVVVPAVIERLQSAFPTLIVIPTSTHAREVIQYCIKEK